MPFSILPTKRSALNRLLGLRSTLVIWEPRDCDTTAHPTAVPWIRSHESTQAPGRALLLKDEFLYGSSLDYLVVDE